jgi:hypothetical protein
MSRDPSAPNNLRGRCMGIMERMAGLIAARAKNFNLWRSGSCD